MPIKSSETMMTTTEAAAYLGLSDVTVRIYVQRGLLRAKKIGPINLLTKSECDRYKKEKRPRGNPNLASGND